MKKPADWLAWVLQFVFGFIAGVSFGVLTLPRGFGSPVELAPAYGLGCGLIGASLASRYGDRFWIGDSYRVIPPDEPHGNRVSRMMSVLTGLAGCAVVLFALLVK